MNNKQDRYLVAIGVLFFLLLCLVPSGQAQTATPLPWTNNPAQLALRWTFTANSSPTGAFDVKGLSYWQISFIPTGTVSGCSISFDSNASPTGNTFTTGGILSAATIGACTPSGSYSNSSGTTPTYFGQITPSITGTGSVTVILLGYVNAPTSSGGSGPASNVSVTNLPSNYPNASVGTNASSAPSSSTLVAGKNAGNSTPLATDASGNVGVNIQNTTGTSGPISITSTQAASVTVGGASVVQIAVTGTWTGTLQPKASVDGTNFVNAVVWPTFPFAVQQSTITANGTFCAIVGAANIFEVLGNTVATGTATVTLNASPGNGCTSPFMGIYSSSLPTLASGSPSWISLDVNGQVRLCSNMTGTTPATAPNCTDTIGGIYNATTAPSPTTGQTLPLQVGPQGQLFVVGEAEPNSLGATKFSAQSSLTTAVVVKSSVGNVYAVDVYNAAATVCYLELINASTGPALGTNPAFSFSVPATSGRMIFIGTYAMGNFTTGISVGMATTYNGASPCGTAGSATVFYE